MIFEKIVGEILRNKNNKNYTNLIFRKPNKIKSFYSRRGFNTPPLWGDNKGIKSETNHLYEPTYLAACGEVVDKDVCNVSVYNVRFFPHSLISFKEQFFIEFKDYIKGKFPEENRRNKIVEILNFFIPNIIFVKWIDITLEKKLIIFDLLLVFFQNNDYNYSRNLFKINFEKVLNLYSILCIYVSIMSKLYSDNLELLLGELLNIESIEENIMSLFFNIITKPEMVNNDIVLLSSKLDKLESILNFELNNSADRIMKIQKRYYLTMIKKAVKNFHIFFILRRFSYNTFYEWFLNIEDNIESNKKHKNNLYKDLGL